MDMSNVKRITFPGPPRLPEAYQEVSYLKTHADGYIETGFAFTEPELKVEFKYMKESVLTTNLFGVDTSDVVGGRFMHGNIYNNNFYCGNGGRGITIPEGAQSIGKVYEGSFELIGTKADEQKAILKLNGGTQINVNSAQNFFPGSSLTDYVLAVRRDAGGTVGFPFIGKVYYIRYYDSTGEMVRHFIPCYRKADGVVGLYDLCGSICAKSGTSFYVNEEEGSFQKGADVFGAAVTKIHRNGVLIWEEE